MPVKEISISRPQPIHIACRPVHIRNNSTRQNTLLQKLSVHIECMSPVANNSKSTWHNLSRTSLKSNTAVNRTTETRSADFLSQNKPMDSGRTSPEDS